MSCICPRIGEKHLPHSACPRCWGSASNQQGPRPLLGTHASHTWDRILGPWNGQHVVGLGVYVIGDSIAVK